MIGLDCLEKLRVALDKPDENGRSFLQSMTEILFGDNPRVGSEILFFNSQQRVLEQISRHNLPELSGFRIRRVRGDKSLCSAALEGRASLLVRDVSKEPRFLPITSRHTHSEIVVPLWVNGDHHDPIGVLNIEAVDDVLTEAHVTILESLRNHLAMKLKSDLERNSDERIEAARRQLRPNSAQNIDDLLTTLLDVAMPLLDIWHGCVFAVTTDDRLRVVANRGTIMRPGEVHDSGEFSVIQRALQSPSGDEYWERDRESRNQYADLVQDEGVEIRSNYAICLRGPHQQALAVLNLEHTEIVITERLRMGIRKLCDQTASRLFALMDQDEHRRCRMIRTVHSYVHKWRSVVQTVQRGLVNGTYSPQQAAQALEEEILENGRQFESLVKMLGSTDKNVSLRRIVDLATRHATRHGVELECRVPSDFVIVATEEALDVLFFNLIQNTARHVAKPEKRAELHFEYLPEAERGCLVYRDNGWVAPDFDTETFRQGKAGHWGMQSITYGCHKLHWSIDIRRLEDGGVGYEFRFPVARSEQPFEANDTTDNSETKQRPESTLEETLNPHGIGHERE